MNSNKLKSYLIAVVLVVGVNCTKAQEARVGDYVVNGIQSGVVFYVDSTGQHGWAVELRDHDYSNWGKWGEDTPLPNVWRRKDALSDFNGNNNTAFILDHPYECPAFYSFYTERGLYLPAIGQLAVLYKNIQKVNEGIVAAGGAALEETYWSSTEHSRCHAWYMSVTEGVFSSAEGVCDKSCSRCIRGVFDF